MMRTNSFRTRTRLSFFTAAIFIFTMTFSPTAKGNSRETGEAAFSTSALLSSPLPFPGPAPKSLPATFEAENFDRGGEGVGYHEIAGSTGSGLYRYGPVESVDIQAFSGASSGFVVTEASAGEWLSYTIFADIAGSYELGIRYTSQLRDGTFHIEIDGQNMTGAITVASSGANFRSVFKRADLTAGEHTMRLMADKNSTDPDTGAAAAGVCDFDSISFRLLKAVAKNDLKENGVFSFSTNDIYAFLTPVRPTINSMRLSL
jgi:hypothetical protein